MHSQDCFDVTTVARILQSAGCGCIAPVLCLVLRPSPVMRRIFVGQGAGSSGKGKKGSGGAAGAAGPGKASGGEAGMKQSEQKQVCCT